MPPKKKPASKAKAKKTTKPRRAKRSELDTPNARLFMDIVTGRIRPQM
jgi:hypothetical protein